MTHLNIEQNTGVTEEVNSSIIQKLYEIAVEGDLDNSSNLKGRLHTALAYEKFITGLTNKFDELYINADNMYAWFEDDTVRTLLANGIGDGTGVTINTIQTLNRFPSNLFSNNTSIQTFDELSQFTNITTIDDQSRLYFNGCTNLKSIDLSNITKVSGSNGYQRFNFENCSNLESVGNTQNLVHIGYGAFDSCSKLRSINISNATYIGVNAFWGCSNLTIETINCPNLQFIGEASFRAVSSIKHVQDLGIITTIGSVWVDQGPFTQCTELLDVIIPETTTTVKYGLFNGNNKLRWVKLLSTTLPIYNTTDGHGNNHLFGRAFGESYNNNDSTDTYLGATYPIYVRDNLLSQYQADDKWSKLGPGRLRALSQFSTDFPNE